MNKMQVKYSKWIISILSYLLVILIPITAFAADEAHPSGGKADQECSHLMIKVDLSTYRDSKGRQQGSVDAGTGLILQMEPTKNPHPEYWRGEWRGCLMTVLDRGVKVKEIKTDGYFSGYSRHKAGLATYWVVESYSGGAHCCYKQDFFCRPAPKKPIKFLGPVDLADGARWSYRNKFNCRAGKIYFEILDWRFAYFHTSFAQSVAFPRFYFVNPEEIKLANDHFKEAFLKEANKIEHQIKEEVAKRRAKPAAIINKYGNLTDDLAGLLVARTVNLMCAREGGRAWKTFASDTHKFYQTSRGLKSLEKEIKKLMESKPY